MRRLRFTLRDWMWLTAVVVIGAGWYVHYQHTMQTVKSLSPRTYTHITGVYAYPNKLKPGVPIPESRE